MVKYWLFEKTAVEILVNHPDMQSLEFEVGNKFIKYLKEETNEILLTGIATKRTKDGIIFAGGKLKKTFVLIDLEKCGIENQLSCAELLTLLQKLFRFCIRYWENMGFTSCEKSYKNNFSAIFPFPFVAGASYHLVLKRDPRIPRLDKRGIENSLYAYKYTNDSTGLLYKEQEPDYSIFRNGGEDYLSSIPEIRKQLEESTQRESAVHNHTQINIVESDPMKKANIFRYLPYEQQLEKLTLSQQKVVFDMQMDSPVRIEGPAGTGKTVSMILKAITMLKRAEESNIEYHIIFLAHSKSTESAIKDYFSKLSNGLWTEANNFQNIKITTLLDYCASYAQVSFDQLVDRDAAESKQNQRFFISEALYKAKNEYFNTYKIMMSEATIDFFEREDPSKIEIMLQHEFSVQIKGAADSNLDNYKKLKLLQNGIPMQTDFDKEYIFLIYKLYQESLEILNVYDTDDVSLEALARLNAPLWRRNRVIKGYDYIFVDEMHLFNLNEQQVFHYLTKDADQKSIPICFALDYSQAIGERVHANENYIEQEIKDMNVSAQKYSTVFRNSPYITELCASITASGAMLFQNFINPYRNYQHGFTAKQESICDIPELIMYPNDHLMLASIDSHVKSMINKYKCQPCDIAIIVFDEELIEKISIVEDYQINLLLDKTSSKDPLDRQKLIVTLPEYVNGLEFSGVILTGVDGARVPTKSLLDISKNFLRYTALNQLYLCCSRAKFDVKILGNKLNGVSECLKHSLQNNTLKISE